MSQPGEQLCDAAAMASMISRMATRLAETCGERCPVRVVGIRSRGYPLAQRLAERLRREVGYEVLVGAVDITLYRDDLSQADHWPVLHGTDIPFPIDGCDVVLVDDVLHTGRTVRAALNAVCDLGRPARVRLAVLVDRGHRELPIQPDVVGLTLETPPRQRVRVRITPHDPVDEVLRIDPN